jgi:hypothetical protein
MTIKQQGGVFGRNPTFNNVDVEGNLTVNGEVISDFGTMATQDASAVNITGGDATLDNLTVDTNTLHVDSSNNRIGIGTLSPSSELHISDATNPSIFLEDTNGAKLRISAFNDRIQFENENIYNDIAFHLGGGETFRFDNGGDVTVSTGNLVIGTSGNGIDFSATSGTGTSELFDDYEEGVFSPTVEGTSTAGTVSYTRREGVYTKVGNCVNFWIDVIWASGTGTGNLKITSLPFTSNSRAMIKTASIFSGDVGLTAGNIATCSLSISATQLLISQMPTGGGAISDVSYDAAGQLVICGSYFV